VRHTTAIAGRELRSLFASPVAYVIMTLFAVLAGFFFLTSMLQFMEYIARMQAFQAFDQLRQLNLNDHVLTPFFGVMAIVLLFAVPMVTMGLIAAEKTNGTEELLLTSPITLWELVLGKFLAGAAFVSILVGLVGLYPILLFLYDTPELGRTGAGLLGLLLMSYSYVAIGRGGCRRGHRHGRAPLSLHLRPSGAARARARRHQGPGLLRAHQRGLPDPDEGGRRVGEVAVA
jgi:ABC-2 type transport system permease protein